MAKRSMVLVSFLAAMLSVATPAMAQGAQYATEQQVSGEEITVTGAVFEEEGFVEETYYGIEEEGTGEVYPLVGGPGSDFGPYLGQGTTVTGVVEETSNRFGRVLNVSNIEPAGDGGAAAETTEEFAGLGVVEAVGERSDGTMGYGLSISADEGYYLEGDFDFAAFEGQSVYVTGKVVFSRAGGRFLRVEQIEPSDDGYTSEGREIYFELAVEGTPPAGAKFFGFAGCCGGGPGVDPLLTDNDGDGVYTGTGTYEVTVNPDGSVRPLPVAIFGGVAQDPQAAPDMEPLPGEDGLDIVDFGAIAVEDGQTLSASYSFETGEVSMADEAGTTSAALEGDATEETANEEIAATPLGFGGEKGSAIFEEGGALSFLPDTGGALVLLLGLGALLAAGGGVIYRAAR